MTTIDQIYEPVTIKDGDDLGSNRSSNRPLLELAKTRMSRRTALKGFVTTAAVGALGGTLTSRFALARRPLHARLPVARAGHHRGPCGRARLQRQRPDPLGRSGPARRARIRPDEPDRRGAGQAVRLQLRLSGLFPAAARLRQLRARPAARQPRVHQPGADVPGLDQGSRPARRRARRPRGRHGKPRWRRARTKRPSSRRPRLRPRRPTPPARSWRRASPRRRPSRPGSR